MGQDLNTSDVARLEWCIQTLESVKDLGRYAPLGDRWPDVVMVIGAIKRVLQPNLGDEARGLVAKGLVLGELKNGDRCNWIGQPERLVYLGYNWSGNGHWHQFAKVDAPDKIWCEVPQSDLHRFEKTT